MTTRRSPKESDRRRSTKRPRNSWTSPTHFTPPRKPSKTQAKQGRPVRPKPQFKDTSDAAGDILRRLMERRRAEKSS